MSKIHKSLDDRFDLEKSPILLNGTQALLKKLEIYQSD